MKIRVLYCNMLREACYMVSDEQGESVVIDCGVYTDRERERLKQYVSDNGLKIREHLLTHAHIDHVFGCGFLYREYGVIPRLSRGDGPLFRRQQWQADTFGLPLCEEPFALYDETLVDGQIIEVGNLSIQVLLTPGHSPGGVCYYVTDKETGETALFSGDTLFQGSIGRTDYPKGDYATLIESIEKKLLTLPDSTPVFPGHGFETSIGAEKRTNPFLIKNY